MNGDQVSDEGAESDFEAETPQVKSKMPISYFPCPPTNMYARGRGPMRRESLSKPRVEARSTSMIGPMSSTDRTLKEWTGIMGLRQRYKDRVRHDPEATTKLEGQYTLTFVPETEGNFVVRIWNELMYPSESKRNDSFVYNHLNWSFRTSFLGYMLVAVAQYFFLIFVFTGIISFGSYIEPECTNPNFREESEMFMSAFSLSWNTYSTVGYGNIHPEIGKSSECFLLGFITSFEAFIGILHGGFVGAILFGKVQTIYCRATVIFSDACTIKYGVGVDYGQNTIDDEFDCDCSGMPQDTIDGDPCIEKSNCSTSIGGDTPSLVSRGLPSHMSTSSLSHMSTSSLSHRSPFPVLTFRIVNEMYNIPRCDIMNVVISAVAIVESTKVESFRSGHRVNRRTYPPIKLQPDILPIFERSSYVHHTLDGDSPLLSLAAKREIRRNRGKWPTQFNNVRQLMQHIRFNQITVSLLGISNVSKSEVYARKTYDYSECKIGWQFVGIIYQDRDKLCVDMNLINDVIEQEGGGGEPLKEE